MSMENSQHGYAFQSALYRDLLELKDEGYLSQVINDFRADRFFLNAKNAKGNAKSARAFAAFASKPLRSLR